MRTTTVAPEKGLESDEFEQLLPREFDAEAEYNEDEGEDEFEFDPDLDEEIAEE